MRRKVHVLIVSFGGKGNRRSGRMQRRKILIGSFAG